MAAYRYQISIALSLAFIYYLLIIEIKHRDKPLKMMIPSTGESVSVAENKTSFFCKICLLITEHNNTDNIYIRLMMYKILHRLIKLHIYTKSM